MKKVLRIVLYIVFFVNLLVAGVYYAYYYYHISHSKKMNDTIRYEVVEKQVKALHKAAEEEIRKYSEKKESTKKENTNEDALEPKKTLDFKELKRRNPDIYAWIEIPGTNINYPVLQHSVKNTYYLYHNLDGSLGYPGCIFSEKANGLDFKDQVTVLYGHNMKNGSMFGGLHRFREKSYFDAHPYIYVYTDSDVLVYQIVDAKEWSDRNLKGSYDYKSEQAAEKLLDEVSRKKSGQHRMVKKGDKGRVLVLSTCAVGAKTKRFLVTALEI